MSESVEGYCPMGCGKTLFLGAGGYVTCSWIDCPRPDAAADILLDRDTEHTVTFRDDGYTVKHPIRERLDDALLTCALARELEGYDGPPVLPGLYRALPFGKKWQWTPIQNTELTPAN